MKTYVRPSSDGYRCSLQACSLLLQGWGLRDLPLRASNEGSLRPRVARVQETFESFLSQLHSPNEQFLILLVSHRRSGPAALYCAHRTSTVLSCAFCEQEGTCHSFFIPPSCSRLSLEGWAGRSSNARVERAHSDRARSASRRTTRLPLSSYCWMAESRHFPSWIRMKVQASPDSVGISSLPSTR